MLGRGFRRHERLEDDMQQLGWMGNVAVKQMGLFLFVTSDMCMLC